MKEEWPETRLQAGHRQSRPYGGRQKADDQKSQADRHKRHSQQHGQKYFQRVGARALPTFAESGNRVQLLIDHQIGDKDQPDGKIDPGKHEKEHSCQQGRAEEQGPPDGLAVAALERDEYLVEFHVFAADGGEQRVSGAKGIRTPRANSPSLSRNPGLSTPVESLRVELVGKLCDNKRMAPATSNDSGNGSSKETPRRRSAQVRRETRETQISLTIDLDGTGQSKISTGVPFLDHMLELFSKHGLFDLEVEAAGDLEVDQHHTVEDVGLALGQAFAQALGDKHGIRRYGSYACPLDEALVQIVVDLSGRPYLVYELEPGQERVGDFDTGLVHDFLLSFVNETRMNLHVDCIRGRNPHHMIEAAFKALSRALDAAIQVDPRVEGVPSTKGTL